MRDHTMRDHKRSVWRAIGGVVTLGALPLSCVDEPVVPKDDEVVAREISLEELQEIFTKIAEAMEMLSGSGGASGNADAGAASTDTIPPSLVSVTTDGAGEDIILTFSEPITVPDFVQEAADLANLDVSVFYRAVMDVTIAGHRDITHGASLSDSILTLRVTTPSIEKGQEVLVSYDNPFTVDATNLDAGGLIVDLAGNPLGTFAAQTAVNAVSHDQTFNWVPPPVVSLSALEISESGGEASFTVVLPSQPSDSVSMNLYVVPHVVGWSPRRLTFDEDDWNEPQTVTVTGYPDNNTFNAWVLIVLVVDDVNAVHTREAFVRGVVVDSG